MRKLIFAAVGVAVLAGCAATDGGQVASHEETYTPLGTHLPRKNTRAMADERKFVDKEDFKRQQEMMPEMQGGK